MFRWTWLAILAACQPTVEVTMDGFSVENDVPSDTPAGVVATTFEGPRDGPDVMVMVEDEAWIVDPDTHALLQMPVGQIAVEHEVGEDPTRVIHVGDHVFVTVRGVGEVVRLDKVGDAWVEGARRYVGSEPYSLAMSNHRDALWVSLSMEDAIVELDPRTLAERQRVAVPHQPQGLAVSPLGVEEAVYVGSASAPEVHTVRRDGSLQTERLPSMRRFVDEGCPDYLLDMRITGDLALTGDGERLLVPSLYVDSHLEEPPLPTDAVGNVIASSTADCRERPVHDSEQYYGVPSEVARPAKVGRFNPALVVLDVASNESTALHLGTRSSEDCGQEVIRAYPARVEPYSSGDMSLAAVAIEGTGNIIAVDLDASRSLEGEFEVAGGRASCGPVGLRGLAVRDDALWGWSFIMRQLNGWVIQADGLPQKRDFVQQTAIGSEEIPRDINYGRLLFFSSNRVEMAASNSGVSCATCHAEGRTDGLTWHLPEGPRQTPSLAGHVGSTSPVTWSGTVASVEEEVLRTSSDRMGGTGGVAYDRQAVAAFVNSTRPIDVPVALDPGLVALGETLFLSPEVGCAACHQGPDGTDNINHQVFGFSEPTNTPPLRGIVGTAPYLHDGSADSLRAVLLRARDGSMGNTSSLTDHELDALEAYLRSR